MKIADVKNVLTLFDEVLIYIIKTFSKQYFMFFVFASATIFPKHFFCGPP